MFWQLPSGTYFEGLVTRIRWCYIKMVNNYVFHKVLHSEKSAIKYSFGVVHWTREISFLNSRSRVWCKEIHWQVSSLYHQIVPWMPHSRIRKNWGEDFDVGNKVKWQNGYSTVFRPRIMIFLSSSGSQQTIGKAQPLLLWDFSEY